MRKGVETSGWHLILPTEEGSGWLQTDNWQQTAWGLESIALEWGMTEGGSQAQ